MLTQNYHLFFEIFEDLGTEDTLSILLMREFSGEAVHSLVVVVAIELPQISNDFFFIAIVDKTKQILEIG